MNVARAPYLVLVPLLLVACGHAGAHAPSASPASTAAATATRAINAVASSTAAIATATPPAPSTPAATATAVAPAPTATPAAVMPNPALTPGDVFAGVTKEQVCVAGYARGVRSVSATEKLQVYAEYGVEQRAYGAYEVDHLVPLELGGSNDIKNLWPEPAVPVPGFHEKDDLENRLHDLVCGGQIGLAEAQHAIASDWLTAYWRYVGGIDR